MAGIPTFIKSFGSASFYLNSNITISGQDNTGSIRHNSNLLISAINCQLDIIQTSNSKIQVKDSIINCKFSPNLSLKGKNNNCILEDNSHLTLIGDGNKVNAVSNTNLKLNITSSTLNLNNNQNAEIEMRGGDVRADENSNLKITGNGGNVNVKGTKNLFIQSLLGKSGAKAGQNEVEVMPGSSKNIFGNGGWLSSILSGWSHDAETDVKYSLTYIDNIQVKGNKYKVDELNFTMEPKSESKFMVNLSENNVDPGSLSVKTVEPNQCFVSATKNGEKLTWRFTAPKIIPCIDGCNKETKFTLDMGKCHSNH